MEDGKSSLQQRDRHCRDLSWPSGASLPGRDSGPRVRGNAMGLILVMGRESSRYGALLNERKIVQSILLPKKNGVVSALQSEAGSFVGYLSGIILYINEQANRRLLS